MNATFTPGPWSVTRIDYDRYNEDASFEVRAGGRVVVQTYMREIATEAQLLAEDEANVRLIAAAPKLYAALVRAERVLDGACLAQARAALASCDTHPKDGDALAAPLVSGAVPKADAQTEPSND